MRFSLPLLLALSAAPLPADDNWISFGQNATVHKTGNNHDFTIGAGQTGHMVVPFSEFTLAEESPPDPDGHLELRKLRSIGFVDVIGTLEGAKNRNTFWLAEVRAK